MSVGADSRKRAWVAGRGSSWAGVVQSVPGRGQTQFKRTLDEATGMSRPTHATRWSKTIAGRANGGGRLRGTFQAEAWSGERAWASGAQLGPTSTRQRLRVARRADGRGRGLARSEGRGSEAQATAPRCGQVCGAGSVWCVCQFNWAGLGRRQEANTERNVMTDDEGQAWAGGPVGTRTYASTTSDAVQQAIEEKMRCSSVCRVYVGSRESKRRVHSRAAAAWHKQGRAGRASGQSSVG
jgi:hypothetical protein